MLVDWGAEGGRVVINNERWTISTEDVKTVEDSPSAYTPDELDIQIIQLLQLDGSNSSARIARALGVSKGTVLNRMARLEAQGIVRRTCAVDVARLGYPVFVSVKCQVEKGKIAECARELSAMEELSSVSITTGSFDIHAVGHLRSESELLDFLNNRLPHVESIVRSEVVHILSFEKNTFGRSPWGAGGPDGHRRRKRIQKPAVI